ncbi:STAS domain-containing protein [Candidatus Peregrinibacteria bacterium]|nr:STAS domain-containing protein [Candidatus Peregrinibacteria bacterium]
MSLLTIKFITDISDLDYQVIEFSGELDSASLRDAEKKIFEFLPHFKHRFLFFDFTNLKFINSEGIGFTATVMEKLAKTGKKLILFGAKSHVADVFNAIGLGKMMPVFHSIREAINFIKKS